LWSAYNPGRKDIIHDPGIIKRINFPLFIGGIIVMLLAIISLYPAIFTSNDPLFEESPKYIEYKENGQWIEKFAYNPMRPNKENIMGTDDAGRDIYSRLIYGTRNTMKLGLLIVLFRFAIAIPIGLGAGMGIRSASGIIKTCTTFFTAVPMLIFCFIVLNIGYFRSLQMDASIMAFALVLAAAGWSKSASYIEGTVKKVMDEPFIEGQIAIGKSKLQIMYQNVLPHIIPEGVSLFFKEIAMALFLVAQLAFLYIFVGVTRPVKALAFIANYNMILEPEWGGTLSRIAVDVHRYQRVYWITFYPILVFSVAIMGINLLGEGLKLEFQKRNSKVVSYIKKGFIFASPGIFISQVVNIRRYFAPVILKTLLVILIILAFTVNLYPSRYKFDRNLAMSHLDELSDDKYEGRAAGTKGGYLAGEYIIKTLRSYGFIVETAKIPVISEKTGNMSIFTPIVIESANIRLTDPEGNTTIYYIRDDFSILAIDDTLLGSDPEETIYYRGMTTEIPDTEGTIYLDRNFSGIQVHMYDMPGQRVTGAENKVSFVMIEDYERRHNTYLFKSTVIIPHDRLRQALDSDPMFAEISFAAPAVSDHPVRNITATLPGKGRTYDDPGEIIIIGAPYDGVYSKDTAEKYIMTAAPAAVMLETARVISQLEKPLDKTIQFIFWDNEFEDMIYSPLSGSYHYSMTEKIPIMMVNSHGYYYFDVSYPGTSDEKYLNLVSYPAQRADKSNYLLGLEIEKRLKAMNVKYLRFRYNLRPTKALRHMRLNALTSVGIGNSTTTAVNNKYDDPGNIDYSRFYAIGQALVDVLTMNPYIME